jgi:hypothetical protein
MKKLSIILLVIMLLSGAVVFAAEIFGGYGKMPWGTDINSITKAYPKGKMDKLGTQDIYKQLKPAKDIKQRIFVFNDNKLVEVTVTMDPDYVKKTGIEKLLARQKKIYGEGVIDRTREPHMVTLLWQDKDTRITFVYAPKRPDMAVMMYNKNNPTP